MRNQRILLAAFVALFVITRLAVLLDAQVSAPALFSYLDNQDMHAYQAWGSDIAAGRLTESTWNGKPYALLYALFCGVLFWIFAATPVTVVVAHLLMSAVAALMLRRILIYYVGESYAWLGMFLFLLFGPLAFYELFLLRDALVCFTVIAMWWSWVEIRQGRLGFLLPLCLFSAAALLLRANTLLLVVFFAVALLTRANRAGRRKMRDAAVYVVLTALLVLPLTVFQKRTAPRNDRGFARMLLAGNFHDAVGYGADLGGTPKKRQLLRRAGGIKLLTAIAKDALQHPVAWLRLYANKHWALGGDKELPNNVNFYLARRFVGCMAALPLSWALLVAFGLVGLTLSWRDDRRYRELAWFSAVSALSLLLFIILGRYRLQLLPMAIVFSTIAVKKAVGFWRQGRHQSLGWLSLAIMGLMTLSYLGPGVRVRSQDYAIFAMQHLKIKDYERAIELLEKGRAMEYFPEYDHYLHVARTALQRLKLESGE